MQKVLNIIFIITALAFTGNMHAQDIEEVAKAPIMTTNGGVSMSHIANFSPDTNTPGNDYSWYLSGNINTMLFGVVNLPFSFAYTNNQVTSQLPQPFNRFSMSPSYKWITTHIGYASMNFSPYTLAGHEFLGGGVELTPGETFKISAMYGRLRKAVNPDTTGTGPSYKRMGGGLKLEYLNEKIDASVNVFKAKDGENSVYFPEPDSTYLKPQDNICGSAAINLKMVNNLSFMAEYAISAMNHDISKIDSLPSEGGLFLTRDGDKSTYHAFKASISQSSKIGQIGATYERVAPNYKTLGAYYFNNDFENITANFSTSIKKRVNLAMDAGYQRDNLEKQKTNTSARMIYSANVSSAITKKLNVAGSISNLQTHVHIKDIYNEVTQTNEFENLDTLSFTQLNLTESINLNYVIQSTKQIRQNLNAGFTYQEASEQQEDDERFVGNQIYNSTLSYQFSLIPQRLNISTSVNHNHNKMPEATMTVMSYNLSVQKAFFESFKAAFIGTYSNSSNNEGTIANIVNLRLTGGYTLQKRHNFNLSAAMVNNNGLQGTSTRYSVNFAYSYMFNFLVKREDKKMNFEGSF